MSSKSYSKTVSREKYEKAKDACTAWHLACQKKDTRIMELEKELSQLGNAKEELESVRGELERWKRLCENLPDPQIIEELQEQLEKKVKSEKSLLKQLAEKEHVYRQELAEKEKECRETLTRIEYQNRIASLEAQVRNLVQEKKV